MKPDAPISDGTPPVRRCWFWFFPILLLAAVIAVLQMPKSHDEIIAELEQLGVEISFDGGYLSACVDETPPPSRTSSRGLLDRICFWKTPPDPNAPPSFDLPRIVKYLRQIEDCPEIHLTIYNASTLKDISPLTKLSTLESLTLWQCDAIDSLTPIGELKTLKHLELSECSQLRSLGTFSKLRSLESLSLSECPNLQDLTVLETFDRLEHLTLHNALPGGNTNPIGKLSALEDLTLITGSPFDITPLTSLSNLRSLRLGPLGQIQDLAFLTSFPELWGLHLIHATDIADIEPVSKLANLQHVTLGGFNALEDTWPLLSLPNLKTLQIQGSAVHDPKILSQLKARFQQLGLDDTQRAILKSAEEAP